MLFKHYTKHSRMKALAVMTCSMQECIMYRAEPHQALGTA